MKPSPTTDNTSTLCLPGADSWELWKASPAGWQRQPGTDPAAGPSSFKNATIFAYPVSSAFAVPIRSATGDPDLLPDLIEIQLEKQGLKPDAPVGCLTDWRVVDREENETLIAASVLNPALSDDLPREAPARFEISPDLYDLPDDSLVIWKELGRLVFAVTRHEHPIYFHALSAPALTPAVVQEIEHLMMPLYTQGIVTALDSTVLWTDAVDPQVESLLQDIFGARVIHARQPAPRPGSRTSAIEPVSIAQGKIRAARAARIQKIAAACVAAYLLIPGFFTVRYFMESSKIKTLQSTVAALESKYGGVQNVLDQSAMADSAVNREQFPVEWLMQCLTSLYDTANPGVRITSFDIEKAHGDTKASQITIKGEVAGNAAMAIAYGNKVKGNPALQQMEWKTSPQAAKDGKVAFTIAGITKNDSP
ncbi:MAG: hypothetical protein V4726_02200 [Verrucomicrobiota bacterium]